MTCPSVFLNSNAGFRLACAGFLLTMQYLAGTPFAQSDSAMPSPEEPAYVLQTENDTMQFSRFDIYSAKLDYEPHGFRIPKYGVSRSYFSYERTSYSPDRIGHLAFLINQGLTILQGDDDGLTKVPWFLRVNYQGGYDFNTAYHSGPIVSRLQNPSIFVEADWPSNKFGILLGYAHESNGQYLSSDSDAIWFENIGAGKNDPNSEPQDFASMGWDYLFIKGVKDYPWLSVSLEYRHHLQQGTIVKWGAKRSRIEDTSFFDDGPHRRIMDVDGARIGVSFKKSLLPWNGVLSFTATFPEFCNNLSSLREYFDFVGMPVSVMHSHEWRHVPWFVAFSYGRMTTLARFDEEKQWKLNIGVSIPMINNEGIHFPWI
jgi:hypothetical protein